MADSVGDVQCAVCSVRHDNAANSEVLEEARQYLIYRPCPGAAHPWRYSEWLPLEHRQECANTVTVTVTVTLRHLHKRGLWAVPLDGIVRPVFRVPPPLNEWRTMPGLISRACAATLALQEVGLANGRLGQLSSHDGMIAALMWAAACGTGLQ